MSANQGRPENDDTQAAQRPSIGHSLHGSPYGELPFAREAMEKIAAYAKGDAAWANRLGESAQTIARQEGWTVVPVDAVKAALLECWMRERRIPQRQPIAADDGIPGIAVTPAGRDIAAPPLPLPATPRRLVASEPSVAAPDAPLRPRPTSAGSERFRYSVVAAIACTVLLVGSVSIGLWEEPLLPPPASLPPLQPARQIQPAAPLPPPISIPALPEPLSAPPSPPVAEEAQVNASPPPPHAAESPVTTPEKPIPAPSVPPPAAPQGGLGEYAPVPAVREMQQLLTRLGYRTGPIDGWLGPRTRAAIRSFQGDAGLPVNGEVTPQLLQKLQSRASTLGGPATRADPQPTPPGVPAEPGLGDTALRTASKWMGALFDSVKRPEEVEAHCRAVPDNWFYDEAKGGLVNCGRFVDASNAASRGKHDP